LLKLATVLSTLAAVALVATLPSTVLAAATAEVGKPAPAFTLKDDSGRVHALAQYRGKVVVLEWTNPRCPFVNRHYAASTMATTRAGFDAQKVVWLAVDSSSTPAAKGLGYPVLQDAAGTVGRSFGAKTTPHMFVIDAQGVVRYSGAIDDDARGNKRTGVTNYVKGAVNALLSGNRVPVSTTEPYGSSVKYAF
jgi:peroxiredoxin